MAGFEYLKDRVVIDWGKSPLAWHQWLKDKEIVEILTPGYVKDIPGYLNFILTHDELVGICSNPSANREWHRMLSSAAGIYLVVDRPTGLQNVYFFCNFFKSLTLLTLWIYKFCDFMSYLAIGL